jgi:hypothetical protein
MTAGNSMLNFRLVKLRLESSSAASNLACPTPVCALLIQNTACRHTEKLMLSVRESLCTAQRQLNGITLRVRGFYLDRYKLARLECLIKILKGVQLICIALLGLKWF